MLTSVSGPAGLVGPEPSVNGLPLEPGDQYAHDHLAWLDRMVRSNQQLVERMALVFQDWFGIRSDDVGSYELTARTSSCIASTRSARSGTWSMDVTKDPAMLLFLSGANSDPNHPNENYGREVMNLSPCSAPTAARTRSSTAAVSAGPAALRTRCLWNCSPRARDAAV